MRLAGTLCQLATLAVFPALCAAAAQTERVEDPIPERIRKGDVVIAAATDIPAGVVLFNVELDEDVWIVSEGVVPVSVIASGALADGVLLTMGAAGSLTDTGATNDNAIGVTAEAIGGGQTVDEGVSRLVGGDAASSSPADLEAPRLQRGVFIL